MRVHKTFLRCFNVLKPILAFAMESTMSVQRKHRGTRSHTPPSFNQQQAKKKRPKKTTNSKIITIRRIKVAPAPVLRRGLARSTWFPPTYIIIVSEFNFKAQLWDLILLPSPRGQVRQRFELAGWWTAFWFFLVYDRPSS